MKPKTKLYRAWVKVDGRFCGEGSNRVLRAYAPIRARNSHAAWKIFDRLLNAHCGCCDKPTSVRDALAEPDVFVEPAPAGPYQNGCRTVLRFVFPCKK